MAESTAHHKPMTDDRLRESLDALTQWAGTNETMTVAQAQERLQKELGLTPIQSNLVIRTYVELNRS